jgi:outer membrane immunogenic protein
MSISILRISLATAALALTAPAVLAADLPPPPPPMEELRPATYDWTGPYIGGFISAVGTEGHYDKVPDCVPGAPPCPPIDPEMSGTGFLGGVLAGWNYDMDGFVIGLEGDYGWGGQQAQNRDPAEDTSLRYKDMATIRARAGMAFDDTLIYATGGGAFVNAEFAGDVGPAGAAFHDKDSAWVSGWAVGGGIEHAFTDNFHGRLEYLYVMLDDQDYRLEDPNGFGGDVDMQWDNIHMVRAALTYNFSW